MWRMEEYDVDLHIHSLHSIGVSKHMTIPALTQGAIEKGLAVLGTGDATQPDWLDHLRTHLKEKNGILTTGSVAFILTVEIEDEEAIHHVVILPDFESVENLRSALHPHSPNLDAKWGGRPRVNVSGEKLAGMVRDVGGLIGPAHAFTPFRSIFREGKHDSLKDCYGDETPNIHFLELGLSADTEIADCIPELRRLTYITSSDAHSPTPDKIGREFVRFLMKAPTFEELRLAILRKKGRKPTLNVGFNPRLGKYYLSFCSSCRRTLVLETGSDHPEFDDINIYIHCRTSGEKMRLLQDIHKRNVRCPADGKRLRLGVRDRALMLGDGQSYSPLHRPPYLHIPPLLEVISVGLGVRSTKSKTVMSAYKSMREAFGPETVILTETPIESLRAFNSRIAHVIESYRDGSVGYVAGGGGRYGSIIAPWDVS